MLKEQWDLVKSAITIIQDLSGIIATQQGQIACLSRATGAILDGLGTPVEPAGDYPAVSPETLARVRAEITELERLATLEPKNVV